MALDTYKLTKQQFKKGFERGKELGEKIFQYQDSLITWLIGFAVGGIFLLISNDDKLPLSIKTVEIHILVLLSSTIIFGILFRVIQLILMNRSIAIDTFFLGVFGDVDIPPFEADKEFLDTLTYDKLVEYIKSDFPDCELENKPNLTDFQKNKELPNLKKYYIDLCDFSKKQFDLALDHIADNFQIAFKMDKTKTLLKFKNHKLGFNIVVWNRIVWILFLLSVASFVFTILLLIFKY